MTDSVQEPQVFYGVEGRSEEYRQIDDRRYEERKKNYRFLIVFTAQKSIYDLSHSVGEEEERGYQTCIGVADVIKVNYGIYV